MRGRARVECTGRGNCGLAISELTAAVKSEQLILKAMGSAEEVRGII